MQIHWRNPGDLSELERDFAMRHLEGLAAGHNDLTDVWIDVMPSSDHHRKGNERVKIRCQARRATLIATGQDVETGLALRSAVEKLEREVWRLRDRRTNRRPRELGAAPPHLGIVDRVMRDEGYGFVLTDAGVQVYFHRNALADDLDFDRLEEGQRVALNYHPGEDGPMANVVRSPSPGVGAP
ncbi:MAG TPA: cold shock domain-containing protein [Myxococcota bacterium]|nr:HPF/RaiA family ribosome-associated protein [Myxococcales bacterium]HPG25551.1 cold shock domain-containing protein [Myxococcota bacterium]